METLDEQGEQLDRIEEGLDQINEDVRHAEKNLTEMEKCCGLCLCPCKRTKNIEKTVEYQKTFADGNRDGVITEQPGFGTARRTGGNTEYSGYITRVTNDAREDEMDENIGQVVRIVEDLKGIAIDMGTEVDKQNSQLEIINKKADLTEGRVRMADQRTKGLLNS
ncbi:synaptosomal-associated protein 23-like [Corticium candelabrum]|uniref:synaptosomal-associated protein 23-like n=1 Tax=Corticium candelabrum TaxID=121492 RepID=UPI002E26A791|nr:synaptosomal-associated protein 23-like [Corticium candelabrum]